MFDFEYIMLPLMLGNYVILGTDYGWNIDAWIHGFKKRLRRMSQGDAP